MIRNREEVESVLKEVEKILLKRPELAEMSIHDMHNELDDGTEQMIHYRWGVAAWLVVKPLKSFEPKMLIEPLSKVDSGVLTYEYAGYLLQSKYKVSMVELILNADECGIFDKIISYVTENIIYEEKFCEQYVIKILNMMGNHKEYNFSLALHNLKDIYNYAEPYENVILTGLVALFEICFDQSWKAMKEVLEYNGFEEGATGSPRQILKTAFEAGLIKDEKVWIKALVSRNNVAHAYNKDVALDIVKVVGENYVSMFEALKSEMEGNWL